MRNKQKLIWIACYAFVSFCMAAEPIMLLATRETVTIAFGVTIYLVLALAAAGLLLFWASVLGLQAFALLLAAALTFNLFSIKLSFYPAVIAMKTTPYWVLVIAAFFAIWRPLLRAIKHDRPPGQVAFVLPAIVFLSPLALAAFDSGTPLSTPADQDAAAWRNVRFSQRPNIYLLGYDSLLPADVAADLLGIDHLAYQKTIDAYFTEIPNAVNFQVPTSPALNAVMRLDQSRAEPRFDLFAGRHPSALEQMMHGNGYRVATGFSTYHLGAKGPFVDDYLTLGGFPLEQTTLCIELGDNARMQMRLIFLCSNFIKAKETLDRMLLSALYADRTQSGLAGEWHRKIIAYIGETAITRRPTMGFFYTFRPIGHTPLDYDHESPEKKSAYRAYFATSAQALNQQLIEIHAAIMRDDPEALVLIFGDHGAWLSRLSDAEADPGFYYRDRHRVLMALMKTRNPCASAPRLHYAADYASPSRLLLDVLSCLGQKTPVGEGVLEFDEDPQVLQHAVSPKRAH